MPPHAAIPSARKLALDYISFHHFAAPLGSAPTLPNSITPYSSHQSRFTFHHSRPPAPPMSLSRTIFRDVPVDTWIDRYETSHQNPVNRVFHTFGIPMIAVSIPLFLLAPLIRGFWKIPLSLFTLGWICQFIGHAVEGKPPEFLKDWRFLLVGLRWWLRTIRTANRREEKTTPTAD
jgi:hypothetical protein